MCRWCVRLRSHKQKPHPPPFSLSLALFLCYTRRRRGGDTGEGKPTALFAGSWGLGREKLPFLRTGCSSAVVVPPQHSLLHVERCGAARCGFGVGDITQNKGVLERGMSEPRLASPLPLKAGQMPLWDRQEAHRRPLAFLDEEAFSAPGSEKEEGRIRGKGHAERETHKSAATMFPQNRPPVSRLRYYEAV